MSESERRCRNCGRPIVRSGFVWLHLPIEPEASAFHYCTIQPYKALTSNPHAEPEPTSTNPKEQA